MHKLFYEGGEVNIFGIDVRPPQVPEGAADCSARAMVPNVLKSRDKFNNQGLTEFEVYTVVAADEGWRIDAQQTLFEQAEVDGCPSNGALAALPPDRPVERRRHAGEDTLLVRP